MASGVSEQAASEGFVVSPASRDSEHPPTARANDAVFFEDSSVGWGVGVVLGETPEGTLLIRDPQRGIEVTVSATARVVPVPPAFTKLTPESFVELTTLGQLPRLPDRAKEPATLITLLHRMNHGKWELPITVNPPLIAAFSGAEPDIQEPVRQLVSAVTQFEADRCLVIMPTGTGASTPQSGRAAFKIPRHYMQTQQRQLQQQQQHPNGGSFDSPNPNRHNASHTAQLVLVESLATHSTYACACVSSMSYTMELTHGPAGMVEGMKIRPIVFDHSLADTLFPYPAPDKGKPPGMAEKSPPLFFIQLADSPMISDLGLPPQPTMLKMMPACHFDGEAPSFEDARAAFDLLGVAGKIGVHAWAVAAGTAHLLLARWVLLREKDAAAGGAAPPPFGILTVEEHILWAAKCLQIPRDVMFDVVSEQNGAAGMQLDFHVTEASLSSAASHLYNRMAHEVLRAAGENPSTPATRPHPPGLTTHVVSVAPFQPLPGSGQGGSGPGGYECRRVNASDFPYLVEAVTQFYRRHAPDRAEHAAFLVSQSTDAGKAAQLLDSIESKYDRPGWFASRERIHDLYRQCRPELLPSLDDILLQYRGRERELFEALEVKYGLEDTAGPALDEQLVAFFKSRDPRRLDDVRRLADEWTADPQALERKLDEEYDSSFLAVRRRAWVLYSKHRPEHLSHLDAILGSEKFEGREEELLESIRAKYEDAPPGGTPGAARRTAGELPRLVQNSVHEVFHLLFLHHFYPQGITRGRRELVDALISTAAPSVVASAIDTMTREHPQKPAEDIVAEVTNRFGGGPAPRITGQQASLHVRHSLESASYDLSSVAAMNVDPYANAALHISGNALVRSIAQRSLKENDTYISRAVKALTAVMATLAAVTSPTSWILNLDTHHAPGQTEVHVPTVLRQLRAFDLDLIAGAPPPAAAALPLSPGSPARTEKEVRKVRDALHAKLPAAFTDADPPPGSPARRDGTGGFAYLGNATSIEQTEWLRRTQLRESEAAFRALLGTLGGEGAGRVAMWEDEARRRKIIVQALKLRTVYTWLAEGILRLERREHIARARLVRAFCTQKSMLKVVNLERALRGDIRKQEKDDRARLVSITVPIAQALAKKVRDSYRKPTANRYEDHVEPSRGDITRFLELLEEENSRRETTTRPQKVIHFRDDAPRSLHGPAAQAFQSVAPRSFGGGEGGGGGAAKTSPVRISVSSHPAEGRRYPAWQQQLVQQQADSDSVATSDRENRKAAPAGFPTPRIPGTSPPVLRPYQSSSGESNGDGGSPVGGRGAAALRFPGRDRSDSRSRSAVRASEPFDTFPAHPQHHHHHHHHHQPRYQHPATVPAPDAFRGARPGMNEAQFALNRRLEQAVLSSAAETGEARRAIDESFVAMTNNGAGVYPTDYPPFADEVPRTRDTPTLAHVQSKSIDNMPRDLRDFPHHPRHAYPSTGSPRSLHFSPTSLRQLADLLDKKPGARRSRSQSRDGYARSIPRRGRSGSSPAASRRNATPVRRHQFLQKGQGTLVSDGRVPTNTHRASVSPQRRTRGYSRNYPRRLQSPGASAYVAPGIKTVAPHTEEFNDMDAKLKNFDQVRGLVVRLVELQQMLECPDNSSPERQRVLSNKMLEVREELAAVS